MENSKVDKVYVVYDKECPMCHRYCQMVRLREAAGQVVLVDARQSSEMMSEISLMGWDIDHGMVVKVNDNFYYGSDAIHVLALMSNKVGMFNRLNVWFFGSKHLAKVLYPVLRSCRNVILKMMGVSKINNLEIENNDKF